VIHPYAATDGATPVAPTVTADADQLQQVCLNLFINAIQAMPTGGTFEVAIRGVSARKPGLEHTPPGPHVLLEVSDEGVGIPPEDLEKIFQPFYSTKQEAGGSGLGLAVSLGIVKDHDGWIEIESGTRGRTVFRVYLPASPATPPSTSKDPPPIETHILTREDPAPPSLSTPSAEDGELLPHTHVVTERFNKTAKAE
jgi:two-component system cell cycle sensor histidine kinase/response regulator CckA